MKATRLFRSIWRANAVIIFAGGVLSLIVLSIAGYYGLKAAIRERQVTAVVNTDVGQTVKESLSLGNATQVAGHPWLLVPLTSDQKYDQAYFSKSSVAARNYAFISQAVETRWLYPHSRFLIVCASQLPDAGYDEQQITSLISFEVVQHDSNNDQRLTPEDSSVLVFAKPDGAGSAVVLENIRRIVSQELLGEEILVLFEDDEGYAAAAFSLKDYSLLKRERLAPPPVGSRESSSGLAAQVPS